MINSTSIQPLIMLGSKRPHSVLNVRVLKRVLYLYFSILSNLSSVGLSTPNPQNALLYLRVRYVILKYYVITLALSTRVQYISRYRGVIRSTLAY